MEKYCSALLEPEHILNLHLRRHVRKLMTGRLIDEGCESVRSFKPKLVERDGHALYQITFVGN